MTNRSECTFVSLFLKVVSVCRQRGHREWKFETDPRSDMVAHCKVPNRQIQVPSKETHARMAQGQYT